MIGLPIEVRQFFAAVALLERTTITVTNSPRTARALNHQYPTAIATRPIANAIANCKLQFANGAA
jgi:hypothetical protein